MKNILFGFVLALIPVFAVSQTQAVLDEQDPYEQWIAKSICAGKVVSINAIPGGSVLYKSSNIHGGRGPTFLVQNEAERTGKQVIEIRNARCEVIGSFGLYATDQPYGARYYTRSGGSGIDSDGLYAAATAVGSTNILVEGKDKWIRVTDPHNRDGSIRK